MFSSFQTFLDGPADVNSFYFNSHQNEKVRSNRVGRNTHDSNNVVQQMLSGLPEADTKFFEDKYIKE